MVISLNAKLQHVPREDNGIATHIMSRIAETNEADSLRANVIRHMCEHFDAFSGIDEYAINADLPGHIHYASIEERI